MCFSVVQRREKRFTEDETKKFYAEHSSKAFFAELVTFMSSAPVTILMLSKQDAVSALRELLGPTDSVVAKTQAPESLRALFGSDKLKNAVHASSSVTDADRELQLLFPDVIHQSNSQAVKEYLAKNVNPTLMKGLTELCKAKPEDPVVWLSDWLLANNPNKGA